MSYGTKAQRKKNASRELIIPTADDIRIYIEEGLRMNKEHCPAGVSRTTSGECPFYFAGGTCRKCSFAKKEDRVILLAWTSAIASKKRGLCGLPSSRSSNKDSPANPEKARHFPIPRFLKILRRLVTFHNRKGLEKNSLPHQMLKGSSTKRCTEKRVRYAPCHLKTLLLKELFEGGNLYQKISRQIQTMMSQIPAKIYGAFLLLPAYIFLVFFLGAQTASQQFHTDQSWFFLASLLTGCSLTITTLSHGGPFFNLFTRRKV